LPPLGHYPPRLVSACHGSQTQSLCNVDAANAFAYARQPIRRRLPKYSQAACFRLPCCPAAALLPCCCCCYAAMLPGCPALLDNHPGPSQSIYALLCSQPPSCSRILDMGAPAPLAARSTLSVAVDHFQTHDSHQVHYKPLASPQPTQCPIPDVLSDTAPLPGSPNLKAYLRPTEHKQLDNPMRLLAACLGPGN
jgi:hypothetical protein